MRRAADFSITDEAEKDDHESLWEKSVMTATKYKRRSEVGNREIVIGNYDYKARNDHITV